MTYKKLSEICYESTHHNDKIYDSDFSFIATYSIERELHIEMINDITGAIIAKSDCVETWNNYDVLEWIAKTFLNNCY